MVCAGVAGQVASDKVELPAVDRAGQGDAVDRQQPAAAVAELWVFAMAVVDAGGRSLARGSDPAGRSRRVGEYNGYT